jgi:hypothetical protein
MAEGAGSFFDLLRGSIPAPGSGLSGGASAPTFPLSGPGGGAIGPFSPEAVRREALRRAAAGGYSGPRNAPPTPLRPVQGTRVQPGQELSLEHRIRQDPMILNTLMRSGPQAASLLELGDMLDKSTGVPYRRHLMLYPEDANLPMRELMKRVKEMEGKTYVPKPGEFGTSEYPDTGVSYSDYASGKGKKADDFDKFGTTALGGTQGLPSRGKSSPSTAARPQTNSGASRTASVAGVTRESTRPQSVNEQTSTGSQIRTQQPSPAATTKTPQAANPKQTATQASPQRQSATPAASPAQSSSKANTTQAPSPRATQSGSPVKSQTSNPPTEQKSAPVAKAEPSGEALSYFRKNKTSPGWDALGTAVSLVQTSLTPEKGGLKSRAEYDRLLRGSDNFKKLEGNEQQRVRQAFAQWMNEQTIFKGKA